MPLRPASALALLLAGCGGVTSVTVIDPGKTFVLDGSGAASLGFSAELRNTGPVAVDVVEETRGGTRSAARVVAPGDQARVSAGPGTSLRVRNRGASQAEVSLALIGSTNLGMGYVASDSARR